MVDELHKQIEAGDRGFLVFRESEFSRYARWFLSGTIDRMTKTRAYVTLTSGPRWAIDRWNPGATDRRYLRARDGRPPNDRLLVQWYDADHEQVGAIREECRRRQMRSNLRTMGDRLSELSRIGSDRQIVDAYQAIRQPFMERVGYA